MNDLIRLLRTEGPSSPAALMQRLQISQPTLFRWVKGSQDLLAWGPPRRRRVGAIRPIRNLGASFPIFVVSPAGQATLRGHLHTLAPRGSVYVPVANAARAIEFPGIPFFLDDLRPQGFLGKSFQQRFSELNLPERLQDWGPDDILEALVRRGEDLAGNLIIGNESFGRFQRLPRAPGAGDPLPRLAERYDALADQALSQPSVGSSLGGDQPKFTVWRAPRAGVAPAACLIKFSPRGDDPAARRWADLLVAEHLALETLIEAGLPAAASAILRSSQRTYLEVERFDRTVSGGRAPLLSLSALESEWTGASPNWAVAAARLLAADRINPEDAERIRQLEVFGRLIANSDRHAGNLSFMWEPGQTIAILAPAYDMLPMLYAPIGSELSARSFEPPTYEAELAESWRAMLPWAVRFWWRTSEDARVGEEFRGIADRNRALLESL